MTTKEHNALVSKPIPLRDMTSEGQRNWSSLLRSIGMLTDGLDKCKFVKSCISCDHFREDIEVCNKTLPVAMRPPARVIAFGCPAWENLDDDIPF